MEIKCIVKGNFVGKVLILIVLLFGSLAFSSCNSEPEVYNIGILSGIDFLAPVTEGFKAEMTALGYAEGENIIYDVHQTGFDIPNYQSIIRQFVEDEVDLILVYPTEASLEAKAITEGTDIPVVFSFVQIEGVDIVDSISTSGSNITGVRYPGPDIALRRFEVLRQIAPNATDIIVPYQKGYPIVAPQLEILLPAAEAAGVNIIEIPAESAEELASILQERTNSGDIGADAILFVAEPLTVSPDGYAVLSAFAEEHQLPMGGAIFPAEGFGSLFDINADLTSAGSQAAPMVDKILNGTEAGSLPIVSIETTFTINLKQAEEMGLQVPDELISLADNVIR